MHPRCLQFMLSSACVVGLIAGFAIAADNEPAKSPAAKTPAAEAAAAKVRKPAATPDFEARWLAFYRKHLLEAYEQHGRRDPRWDGQAEVFLDEWAGNWVRAPWMAGDRVALTLATAALKAGCDDPLVRGGQLMLKRRLENAAVTDFADIARELSAANYSPFLSAYFAGLAVSNLGSAKPLNEDRYRELVKLLLDETHRLIAEEEIAEGDERSLLVQLNDVYGSKVAWTDAEPMIAKLVEDAKSPQQKWLAHMLAAEFCKSQGWVARGSGYANTVTEEGWRIFHEQIAHMVEHLEAAHQLKPEHPEAAAEMIVAMANGQGGDKGETIETWFRRAVAAQCDYDDAYMRMFQFSSPRWGGSHEIMEKVGKHGLDTGRFDTWAPFQYFNAVAWIARDVPSREAEFWETKLPFYYPQLQRMFAGYEKTERLKDRLPYYRSLHVILATNCHQYEEALVELRKLNDQIHPDAMRYSLMTLQGLLNNVHGFGGKAGKQALEAKRLMAEEKLDEAEKLLREATEIYTAENDKPALMLLAHLSAGVDFQRKLQSNEWVDLTFDEDFTGWTRSRGAWKRKDEKTVIGTGARDGLIMALISPVGHRFEFRGEMQIARSKYNTDNAGVAVCVANKPEVRSLKFLMFPQPSEPRYYLGFGAGNADVTPGDVRLDRNLFDITVWDRSMQVKLNGEVLKRTPWLSDEQPFGEEERIALMGYYYYDGPPVTFRNLQVRKLLNPPEDF